MDDHRSFKPAWWLANPHLQTVWPTLCRRKIKTLSLRRERFELRDGDFVDLDWVGSGQHNPIVVVLHGLEGSVNSPYAQGILHAVVQQGWRGVLMHFRGCSGELNRKSRSYHSGETMDLAEVVAALRQREPTTQLAAVGYSLGGNVLLKWLGELSHSAPLTAAVAVSVPFELHKTAQRIQQGFSKLYQRHFLRYLHQKMVEKFARHPAPFPMPSLHTLKTIRDFDDKVTAPLHGFCSAEDYYQQSSSKQFLRHIRIPTLLLHALDDPLMTKDVVPSPSDLSSHIQLEVSEQGGHVGFVGGTFPWRPEYWLEQRIPQFLTQEFKR